MLFKKTLFQIVKFINSDMIHEGAYAITEADRGILEMKVTTRSLQTQVDEIQRQIEE